MSEIRAATRQRYDDLAREFLAMCRRGEVISCKRFVETRGLSCNPATFWRRVKDFQRRQENGIEVCNVAPWDLLPDSLLGGLIGLLDLYYDPLRKRRGCQPLSSVFAMFNEWAREQQNMDIEVPCDQLRKIAAHRCMARASLSAIGRNTYREVAGKYLQSANERMERVQIDSTEISGPFIGASGQIVDKVHIIIALCVASKVIVGWQCYLRTPRSSDAARLIFQVIQGRNEQIHATLGGPIGCVQTDNGFFRSVLFRDFLERQGIELEHIEPGQPTQNGMIEKP